MTEEEFFELINSAPMTQFSITAENPLEIFVEETTHDPLWNPGIYHYEVKNYKEYMELLQDLMEDALAYTILCKQSDFLFGFQQDADIEGWGGVYDLMSDKDIEHSKHITNLKLIQIAS